VAPLRVPPLRDRREDISLLVRFFVERLCKRLERPPIVIGNKILRKLETHSWPGNVRELENTIERLIVFAQGNAARMEDLPEEIVQPQLVVGKAVIQIPPEGFSLAELDKELITAALERNQWNQSRAADFLRISRNVLVYRMHKYRLGSYKDLPPDGPADIPGEDDPETG
jgi:two-component system NtrC family response regulator